MATFFGEILPDSSRAVDEDDDEDDNEENIRKLLAETKSARVRWSPVVRAELARTKDKKLPCEILIVAVGAAAAGFVQTYILNDMYTIIGALFSGMKDREINSLSQTAPTDRTCYIYQSRLVPEVLVCLCNTEVQPEQSYSWVTQLFSAIGTERTYISILTTYSTSEYKNEVPISEMETPFLRALRTTKYAGTPLCPYLEQPNLVSGLPAQLLTYCQMIDVKAVMYICYTDTIFLDSATMKTFFPVLRSTPIKDIVEDNPKGDQMLNELVELHSVKSTLYL